MNDSPFTIFPFLFFSFLQSMVSLKVSNERLYCCIRAPNTKYSWDSFVKMIRADRDGRTSTFGGLRHFTRCYFSALLVYGWRSKTERFVLINVWSHSWSEHPLYKVLLELVFDGQSEAQLELVTPQCQRFQGLNTLLSFCPSLRTD